MGWKIDDVARHDTHAVDQRRSRDQGAALGAGAGYMKPGAALRDGGVHGEDAAREGRHDLAVDPGAKHRTLACVRSRRRSSERTLVSTRNIRPGRARAAPMPTTLCLMLATVGQALREP